MTNRMNGQDDLPATGKPFLVEAGHDGKALCNLTAEAVKELNAYVALRAQAETLLNDSPNLRDLIKALKIYAPDLLHGARFGG